MKKLLLILSTGFVGMVFGAAELESYATPGYVFGGADVSVEAKDRQQVGEAQLAFPGATLAEIKDLTFFGYMVGMSVNSAACSYFTHEYVDGSGTLQFLAVTVQKEDANRYKGVAVKLTQHDDGVWAERVEGIWLGDMKLYVTPLSISAWDCVAIASDGTIGPRVHYGTDGEFQVKALSALKPVQKNAPALVFANPPGGTTLTVEDIRNYDFTGIATGAAIGHAYVRYQLQNKYVAVDENGIATKIRLELQVLDDQYLKCVVVELTNGADGVYAQATKALYRDVKASGAAFGDPFLNPDGSFAATGIQTSSVNVTADGSYGVASLTATKVTALTYELDASKTWSELAGSASPVDDDSIDITVNVTAADATLTFDTPIRCHNFILVSDDGHGATLAADAGVAAPQATSWDLRGTTGTVAFAGFSPVTDSVTANIMPNAASALVFAGDLGGILPFNDTAVSVPCRQVVLGGTQFFPSGFAFKKVKSLGVEGLLVLGDAPTGTGSLVFKGAGALGITNDVTVAKTVAIAAEAAIPVVAYGEAATLTLNGTVPETGFVLTDGTLHTASLSPNETNVVIGAGATIAITVSDVQKRAGYTSKADLREGGAIRFYDANGSELGVGRPQMNVLPGSDVAWTPKAGGDNTFSTDANWSSGATPASGDVAVSDGGLDGGATVALVALQGFNQISIRSESTIAFVASGEAVLSVTKLVVADYATVTIPLAATYIATVELGVGATLRVAGDADMRNFAAVVTGEGKVEYVTGDVMPTQNNTYTGGTLVKQGAYVRMGHNFSMGARGGTVKVEDGGTLDVNGANGHLLTLDLCGNGVMLEGDVAAGALRTAKTAGDYWAAQFTALTLSGDASICVEGENVALGFVTSGWNGSIPVNLGSYTLTKTGAGTLYFVAKDGIVATGSGRVVIGEGTVQVGFYGNKNQHAESAFGVSSATLEIRQGGKFITYGNLSFGQIENNGRLELCAEAYDLTVADASSYSGDGEVHKFGNSYTAYMPFNNGCHSTWIVHGGRLCPNRYIAAPDNAYAFNTAENPHANPKVIVENSASSMESKFDFNGIGGVTPNLVLSGYRKYGDATARNALCCSVKDLSSWDMQITQLTLADDARVGGSYTFGLLAPNHGETLLELGDKTMTLCLAAGKNFWLDNTTVTGTGKLLVESGIANFTNDGRSGTDWTLEVGPNGSANFVSDATVSNLVFRGTAAGTAGVTAYGTYAPRSASLPKVTLAGAGAGLDLSEMVEPFELSESLSFAEGVRVRVFTGSRDLQYGDQLIRWTEKPANVTAWSISSTHAKHELFRVTAKATGLYVRCPGLTIVFR